MEMIPEMLPLVDDICKCTHHTPIYEQYNLRAIRAKHELGTVQQQ
jgi:hypothetical protein